MYDLSEGSLERYVCYGKHPPKNENIFQVLATKPVEIEGSSSSNGSHTKRYRAIISDGKHHFDFAMFLLFDNTIDAVQETEVPETNSIIKITNPVEALKCQDNFRQNSIKHMNEKLIWIICRFDVLRKGGEKIGTTMKIQPKTTLIAEQESTPQPNKSGSDLGKRQHTPVKRDERSEDSIEANSVKRALFSSDSSRPHPLSNSSLYKPSHKIKDLNPYQNKFRIKARVIRKSELKRWSNSRGEGTVFDVILQDSSGDIKATGFNEVAVKFDEAFEENKVYMVETAQIKPIQNRGYNTTGHNYELTLNHSTKIQEVGETLSRDVPSTLYHFVSISDLSDKPEKEKVDVIGVILEVRDVQDLTTRAGRQTKKRGFQITDSSNCKINATLWGDKAENFPADAINKIIAIKGAEVSEWQGKSLNMGFTSTFEIEPPLCQEAEVLRDWFDREGNCASTQSLTNTSFSVPSGSNKDLVSLAEVKQNVYSNTVADSVKYFNVEASVIIIKTDNIMYRACPNESCRRKVNEDPANSGEFKCQKCDKQYPNFNWRYSLQAAIADFTDFHWVTIFEESGMNILGVSAEELARKKDENRIEYEKILENCKYLSFQFAMKSKVESWNDEKRLRLSIVKAEKVSRDSMDRINRLTSDIDRLKILLNL